MTGSIQDLENENVTLEALGPCKVPALRSLPDGTIGMLNEDWVRLYEACRVEMLEALGRIELWETWERAERVAQEEVKP